MKNKRRISEIILNKSIKSYNRNHVIRAKAYNILLRIVFACDIYYTAHIDESVELIHNGLGVVIHPKSKISKGCKIYQNVTLGGNGKIVNGEKINLGGPKLEEDVTVFAGACVLGPIVIGKGAIVGANAVVTKDVPPNSLAVGVPAVVKPLNNNYNFKVY
ncbi:serine O-acetyltransferase [Romboutsia sp.]|uniref:serine O-acetyltransferase n=1 Tax=Romboutsia sp. TaxID=1965302 RepID=UPI003F3A1363